MTIADLIILTKLHPLEHILDKQVFIFTPHKFDPQQIAIMPRVELSAGIPLSQKFYFHGNPSCVTSTVNNLYVAGIKIPAPTCFHKSNICFAVAVRHDLTLPLYMKYTNCTHTDTHDIQKCG